MYTYVFLEYINIYFIIYGLHNCVCLSAKDAENSTPENAVQPVAQGVNNAVSENTVEPVTPDINNSVPENAVEPATQDINNSVPENTATPVTENKNTIESIFNNIDLDAILSSSTKNTMKIKEVKETAPDSGITG